MDDDDEDPYWAEYYATHTSACANKGAHYPHDHETGGSVFYCPGR
jgi:hypothetical protein